MDRSLGYGLQTLIKSTLSKSLSFVAISLVLLLFITCKFKESFVNR